MPLVWEKGLKNLGFRSETHIYLKCNCRFRPQIQCPEIWDDSVAKELAYILLKVSCKYQQECSEVADSKAFRSYFFKEVLK